MRATGPAGSFVPPLYSGEVRRGPAASQPRKRIGLRAPPPCLLGRPRKTRGRKRKVGGGTRKIVPSPPPSLREARLGVAPQAVALRLGGHGALRDLAGEGGELAGAGGIGRGRALALGTEALAETGVLEVGDLADQQGPPLRGEPFQRLPEI